MTRVIAERSAVMASGLLLATALGLGPTHANAQAASVAAPAAQSTDQTGLDEIIVTAQKRSENLQKVPIAIAAFSADMLEANNVVGLSDLTRVTPGLSYSFQALSGSAFLRGVGNVQTFAGAEAEVQTYIDNVYYASGGGAFAHFNNIDRVEVDKGPQGTLFGRNATGGVIQIFTRDPSDTPTLNASAGYGNFNSKDGDLYASTGFGDELAGDIAVHYDDHDGWGKNIADDKDVYVGKSTDVRSKWVFNPSSDTRLTLIGDYGVDESNIGQLYGVIGAPWSPVPGPAPSSGGFYDVSSDVTHVGKSTQFGGSLKLDTKFSDLSFVSISAYRLTKGIGYLDADGTSTPFLYGFDARREEQGSQEFQLLSPTDGRLQWILGTYLYYNDAMEFPGLSGVPFEAFGAERVDGHSSLTTKSEAAFGQATYTVTPTTHVTAGLRYTHDYRSQNANTVIQYPSGPGAPPPFFGLNVNAYPHATFNAPTGKLLIAQDLSDDAMVYLGYNRGFKSGTFNNILVLSNTLPALQPEYMNAYETGFKGDFFDHRVRFDVAAFLYKYSNLQVNEFENINIALKNAASSTIKGLDGSLEFAATRLTRFQLGFSVLDAKYTSFRDAPLYLVNPLTAPNFGGGGYGGINISAADASGDHLAFAPDFSGFLGVNQIVPLPVGKMDFNATLKYQTRIYFTPDNSYSQGGYATVEATSKWTAPSGKWDISLWGRNLAGTHNYQQFSLSAYGVFATPNEPRTVGARAGVHF